MCSVRRVNGGRFGNVAAGAGHGVDRVDQLARHARAVLAEGYVIAQVDGLACQQLAARRAAVQRDKRQRSAGPAAVHGPQLQEALVHLAHHRRVVAVVDIRRDQHALAAHQHIQRIAERIAQMRDIPMHRDRPAAADQRADEHRQRHADGVGQHPGPAQTLGEGEARILTVALGAREEHMQHPRAGRDGHRAHDLHRPAQVLMMDDKTRAGGQALRAAEGQRLFAHIQTESDELKQRPQVVRSFRQTPGTQQANPIISNVDPLGEELAGFCVKKYRHCAAGLPRRTARRPDARA